MLNARLDLGAAIETAALTKLDAFLNTVDPSSPLSTWDSVNYIGQVANANATRYFNTIGAEMKARNYNGPLQIINDGFANELVDYQIAQSIGNSANLQFQYGDKMLYTSNSITVASDYISNSYAVEQGALGLVDWIPAKNRAGMMEHGDWDFTNMADPFGIFDRLALSIQKKVQNSSAGGQNIGGNTQDAVWIYEMSVDVAFFIPTITTQKLVNKYGLLSS